MSRIGFMIVALLAIVSVVCATSVTAASGSQSEYAYVAVYTAGAPDSHERLLGIRVMIKTLKLTRTPYDIVVLVSPNTEQSVRDSFMADGFKVVEMAQPKPSSVVSASASGTGASSSLSQASETALATTEQSEPSYYQKSCPHSHDWHYIFTLTQYKRVVFVEHDSLVFLNMDDLFMCGKFCMVYANENCWNSGVIVVEPSIAEFNRWEAHFAEKAAVIEKQRQASFMRMHSVRCVDQWHDSLLTMYPSIEASPLFHTSQVQSQEPVMRLHLMYSINAIFFYEHYTWALYSINIKIPAESSGIKYQHLPNPDGSVHVGLPTEVPAFSISFHNPKPYHWFPAGFLDLNFYWQDIRHMLLPADTNRVMMEVALSRLALLALMYFAAAHIMQRFFTQAFREKMLEFWTTMRAVFPMINPVMPSQTQSALHLQADLDEESLVPVKEKDEDINIKLKNLAVNSGAPIEHIRDLSQYYNAATAASASSTTNCLYQVDTRCRAQILGLLLGCAAIGLVTAFFAIPMVPATTPPLLAWVLCCLFQNFALWITLKVLMNVFPSVGIVQNYQEPKLSSFLAPFVLEMIALAHNRARLHTHFVHKILAFEIMLTLIFLLQAKGFRNFVLSHYGFPVGASAAHTAKVLSQDQLPTPRAASASARLGHEEP